MATAYRTHKTFAGMMTAATKTIAYLNAGPIADQAEYDEVPAKVKGLQRELDAIWSNPADSEAAAKMRADLSDAWSKATA